MEEYWTKELRKEIIKRGRESAKFKKFISTKEGAKYYDPNKPDISGAISEKDCLILDTLVKQFKPKVIFEIGTWFGTSAAVMQAAAPDAKIYTCDKHDVCTINVSGISVLHLTSKQAIKKLQKKGVKIDLVFADGRLMDGDEKRLVKMGMKVFLTHDYEGKEKGYWNIKKMKKVFRGKLLTTETTIAGIYGES